MTELKQLRSILEALPDPAFVLSRSGKYVGIFGGKDTRYYHDGSNLVGLYIADLIKPDKAQWFLETIASALESQKLHIEEYELSNKDVIGLSDEGPSEPIWFEGRIQALEFFVDGEEVVLWVASNISERHQLENRLRALSDTDQLTGLYNRHRLQSDSNLHFENYKRYDTLSSLLIFDLDNLKQLNDTFGHHAGDEAIAVIAQSCRKELRETDAAYRLGGDEFTVLLSHTDLSEALHFAKRLKREIDGALAPHGGEQVSLSVSMGLTVFETFDESFSDTLKRADKALYRSKKRGKNQITVFE